MNDRTAVFEALPLASLPALKQPLEGGVFCGVITLPDGKHYAVVKLDAKPEKRLKWQAAMDWAKEVGGQLPSRAVAALLFSVAQNLFEPNWHWTNEPFGSSYAWFCYFYYGTQYYDLTSSEGCAVAVRLIPLTS
jgi:hypothetical protein